jgi:DNA-binding transcriptional LysR family regulator
MSGLVRLTLPRALSELSFAALRRFGELHPDVEVESLTSDVTMDLNGRQADVALRIADAPPEHLIGQRVAKLASAVYASECYWRAHPMPLHSDEHRWVDLGATILR